MMRPTNLVPWAVVVEQSLQWGRSLGSCGNGRPLTLFHKSIRASMGPQPWELRKSGNALEFSVRAVPMHPTSRNRSRNLPHYIDQHLPLSKSMHFSQ